MQGLRAAVGATFGGQALAGLARALTPLAAARLLPVDDFGQYSAAVAVALLVYAVSTAGLSNSAVYFLAREPLKRAEHAATLLTLAFCVSAATTAGVLVALAMSGSISPELAVALVAVPPLCVHKVGVASALGMGRLGAYNALGVGYEVVVLAAVTAGAATTGDGGGAIAGWSAAAVAGAVTVAVVLAVHRPGLVDAGSLARHAAQSHVSSVAGVLSYRLDVVLLAVLAGATEVALYAAVVALAEVAWFPSIVTGTMLQRHVAARPGDLRAALRALVVPVALVTAGGSLLLAVVAPSVLELLFGSDFDEAAQALRWLVPGIVALAASRMLAGLVMARGRPASLIPGSLLGLVVNVGLNLILIPAYGATGAAVASSVAYTVALVDRLRLLARLMRESSPSPAIGTGQHRGGEEPSGFR